MGRILVLFSKVGNGVRAKKRRQAGRSPYNSGLGSAVPLVKLRAGADRRYRFGLRPRWSPEKDSG
jgi:hypothetical protein